MKSVNRIISKFGGVSALASALGHRFPSTVSNWKIRGLIPTQHHASILRAARERGIQLDYSDFFETEDDGHENGAAA